MAKYNIIYLDENFVLSEREIEIDVEITNPCDLVSYTHIHPVWGEIMYLNDAWGYLVEYSYAKENDLPFDAGIGDKVFVRSYQLKEYGQRVLTAYNQQALFPYIDYDSVLHVHYNNGKAMMKTEKKHDSAYFSRKSAIKNCLLMNNTLDNSKVVLFVDGSCRYYDDGKYGSNLIFMIDSLEAAKNFKFYNFGFADYLDCNYVKVCYGRYENKRFYPTTKEKASYALFKADWGGSFNDTDGKTLIERLEKYGIQYKRNATSNGGGTGIIYAIIDKESEERMYGYLSKAVK